MKQFLRTHIPWIAGVAFTGMLVLQVAGFYNYVNIQNDQRSEHLKLSLHRLTQKICRDSLLRDPELLNQEYRKAFQDHSDDTFASPSFHLLIVETKKDRVLFNNQKDKSYANSDFAYKETAYSTHLKQDITVYMNPNTRSEDIQSGILIWLLLSLTLLFIMGYSLIYIIRTSKTQMQLSKVKNDFINNMSHELKTPIATMSVSSEMLIKKEVLSDPERSHRYAGIIREESKRLRYLVDRVLNIAIFEKQQPEFKKEKCDIHQIIRNTLHGFEVIVEKKKGTLHAHLNADSFSIMGDPAHITQALSNLIDNAIKYSPENLYISIRSYNTNNSITIDVEDHGIGIDKKQKERIFDKFHRVSTGDVHDIKGFGIGLYYVKGVVEHHKGEIEVISNPGKGSLFRIILPVIYEHNSKYE